MWWEITGTVDQVSLNGDAAVVRLSKPLANHCFVLIDPETRGHGDLIKKVGGKLREGMELEMWAEWPAERRRGIDSLARGLGVSADALSALHDRLGDPIELISVRYWPPENPQ